jgi:peptidoglycan/xylan/chitin deacetylase (PgdA/CDA1 family)
MTDVLITIDTELSESRHRRGMTLSQNLAASIYGEVAAGSFGIGWQMDLLEAHGLRGVFFVDPSPALVFGEAFLSDVVGSIVSRGHEVQLHTHTEWLALIDAPADRRKDTRFIRDLPGGDQEKLIHYGATLLEKAGVAPPVAFRAGNFAASDETLSALGRLGIIWDSSFNAYHLGKACRIALPAETNGPVRHAGVIEVPVSGLNDRPGRFRPAQVCALSRWEMAAALNHAAEVGQPTFVVVSHGFEMLSRDRQRPNRSVIARFRHLCRLVESHPGLRSIGFRDLDATSLDNGHAAAPLLASNRWRTFQRHAAQAVAMLRCEAVSSYPDLLCDAR